MFIVSFVSGPWQANCYLLSLADPRSTPGQQIVVVDAGVETTATIERVLGAWDATLAGIICTHGHLDHVAEAAPLANAHGVPVWLHPEDRAMLTEPALGLDPNSAPLVEMLLGSRYLPEPDDLRELADGQRLEVAGLGFEVIHAPGHTPGCVVLRAGSADEPLLLSGDVLFAGSIGRVDLPGGSMAVMTRSLRRLRAEIEAGTSILPGHGPATTMAAELANNPYLQEEALA